MPRTGTDYLKKIKATFGFEKTSFFFSNTEENPEGSVIVCCVILLFFIRFYQSEAWNVENCGNVLDYFFTIPINVWMNTVLFLLALSLLRNEEALARRKFIY